MTRAAAAAALFFGFGTAHAAEPLSFSASLEVVRLDVSVTRSGEPVRDLKASDFLVTDNGMRQRVEIVGADETAVYAILALDTSQSLSGPKLERLKAAATQLVKALEPDDALSLLTFSECADLALLASRDRDQAAAAIARATAGRTTALHDTTLACLSLADTSHGRPVVLLFSDGWDVGSYFTAQRALEFARESAVVVHTVMPFGETSSPFVTELTDATGGRVWSGTQDEQVGESLVRALAEFRNRYRLKYEPIGVTRTGWHRIEVRLRNGDADVRARAGYTRRATH
jgi:VWFA-related protein